MDPAQESQRDCAGAMFETKADAFNAIMMLRVMLRRPERREAYTAYQKRTSLLIPMPPNM